MNYTAWGERWEAALAACVHLVGKARELVIRPPASMPEVLSFEKQNGIVLPTSFRNVLTEFSSAVEMAWSLPSGIQLPHELRGIFSGQCSWSLEAIVRAEQSRQLWVEKCFADASDAYNAVWHNKLGFSEVANGDVIAFDLSVFPDSPVVYLSHDDGEGHGYRLGNNFADYIDRISLIGCPGYEDWQMMPFLRDAVSGLDVEGDHARIWRQWFGLRS